MRKSDIENMARHSGNRATLTRQKRIAPDARERPCKREHGAAVNLSRETMDALAEAVAAAITKRLADLLPICARLAAADTLHTSQKPQTVLQDAITEGLMAVDMLGAKP